VFIMKSGAHIWGGGMHRDALLSNYGRGKSLVKFFSLGHNWVIVCLCIKRESLYGRSDSLPHVSFEKAMSKKTIPHVPWEAHEMLLYGKVVNVLIKTQTCLWYTVAGTRLVRMIVTRDPSGRIEDRAYFSTYAEMSPKKIAQFFSLRRPPT